MMPAVFFRWSTAKYRQGEGGGAKVDDIQTGGTQTSDQRAVKGGGGQAAVPGDDNAAGVWWTGVFPLEKMCAVCSAEVFGKDCIESGPTTPLMS